MEFTEHLEFVKILWKLRILEHITSGISFKWCDILCDYGKALCDILCDYGKALCDILCDNWKELCDILVVAARYRKSGG